MREIKFRAWDKNKNKMIMFGLFSNIFLPKDEPSYEFMQFTGLKDKNGKEIYEGDIVKGKDVLGEIAFGEYCQLGADTRATGFHVSTCLGITSQDVQEFDLEVIGNIYENPELLSVTQKEGGGEIRNYKETMQE